jgi:antitoxin component YwqK of YwqJK toxin-antitoxin module
LVVGLIPKSPNRIVLSFYDERHWPGVAESYRWPLKAVSLVALGLALLACVSCANVRTIPKLSKEVEPPTEECAEYLYKVYVLNQGLRPAKGFTGLWRSWYKDGERMAEATLVAGTLHGRCREWNRNGVLIAEGEYRHGYQYEGTFRVWYYIHNDLNKHSYEITTFRRGIRDGPCSDWTKTGVRLSEGQYRQDRREGLWHWWWIDGKLLAVGEYREGRPWNGAFADDEDQDRTRVRYFADGKQNSKAPEFIKKPQRTD